VAYEKSGSWHTNYFISNAKVYTSKFTAALCGFPETEQISCFFWLKGDQMVMVCRYCVAKHSG